MGIGTLVFRGWSRTRRRGDLGIDIVAESVETVQEYLWFVDQGIQLFQGYLFAKPGFEALPAVRFAEIV